MHWEGLRLGWEVSVTTACHEIARFGRKWTPHRQSAAFLFKHFRGGAHRASVLTEGKWRISDWLTAIRGPTHRPGTGSSRQWSKLPIALEFRLHSSLFRSTTCFAKARCMVIRLNRTCTHTHTHAGRFAEWRISFYNALLSVRICYIICEIQLLE